MSSGPYSSFGQQSETQLPPPSNSEAVGFGDTAALEPVVDSEGAARFLSINSKTLQKMARNGEVPGYRISKLWKFRISNLDAWLRSKVISNCHLWRGNERRGPLFTRTHASTEVCERRR
jgi:excisionase family DNA binding protein